MKSIIVLIMLLAVSVFAQSFEGLFWGKAANTKIAWGSTFIATDSLRIKKTQTMLSDSIATTLYTSMLFMDNRAAGTGLVTVSYDTVDDAGMDSCATLWMRFYDDKDVHPVEYWDSWHQVGNYHATGQLYIYQIADSSWWRPARGQQWKTVKFDADDDSASVNLGLYHN